MTASRSFRAIAAQTTTTGKWISKYFIIQTALTHRVVFSCYKTAQTHQTTETHDPVSQKAPVEFCDCTWVGLTVSKKVGNSPCRNRVKRQLRALLQTQLPPLLKKGVTYVFIARNTAATASSEEMLKELRWALGRLHKSYYSS